MSWTPLFSDIVDSSVWGLDHPTRIVWITMLAKKDLNGEVRMSVPGLARAAVVSLEECQRALVVLMSPDPLSRTKDHEGRRIEEVEGGWRILNHFKYRDKIGEHKKEYQRHYMREYRKRRKLAAEVDGARSAIRDGFNDLRQ